MRRQHDQFFKTLAEADPRGLLDMLGILPLDREAEVSPLDREMVRDPVLIDQGFVIHESHADWIAHIEAFSDIADEDWERVLWYAAELTVRTRLPVRSTVLLMLEQYAPKFAPLRCEVRRGGFVASLEIQTVRIWEVPASRLLQTGRPRLLTWVPMTQASEEDWLEAGRKIAWTGDGLLSETFQVLGEMRYGKSIWEEFLERKGLKMIRTEILRKHSPTVQGWFEEGRQEGRLELARDLLRETVQSRFPSLLGYLPADASLDDVEALRKTIHAVMSAQTEQEAKAAIDSLPTGGPSRQ